MPISKIEVTQPKVFEEAKRYRAFIAKRKAALLKKDPHDPNIPEAIFQPEMLLIRRNEGEAPRHKIIKWGCLTDSNAADVKGLLDYFE